MREKGRALINEGLLQKSKAAAQHRKKTEAQGKKEAEPTREQAKENKGAKRITDKTRKGAGKAGPGQVGQELN